MTEKEKQQAGMLYDANHDPEVLADLHRCEQECYEINMIAPDNREERFRRLKKLFGKTGDGFVVVAPFFCDYGYNIKVGDNFFANAYCTILDEAEVSFGDNVFIAPSCSFYTAGHPLNVDERNKGLEYARPIHVGDNVWIGGNVTVCPGVNIGNNVTIGAGSVVTKDIPDNVLAAGNPCKVIRELPPTSISSSSSNEKSSKAGFTYKYPRPAVTADCLVFANTGEGLEILLIQRGNDPCKGQWAFPGGFMNMDETTAEAARRELHEETGLCVGDVFQIGAYDRVDRDPRGRVITVAYYTFIDGIADVKGGDDAALARWFPVSKLPQLAFDHQEILDKALRMIRTRM